MTENKKPNFFYGYFVVGAAFLAMAAAFGTIYTYGVFFKPLSLELGMTRAVTSGANSLRLLLSGVIGILAGRVNDRLGPRVILVACGFFLGLGYVLMSQISATWQLYLFNGVLIGIGMSGLYVPLVSTTARWFVKRRGVMTGIVVSGLGFGTLVMPPIASRLIYAYDWRTSYWILGIMVLVLTLLAAQFLRRDPSQKGLLPWGEGEVNQESPNLAGRGFSFREAIYTRQFWMICAMFFCFAFGIQVILVHIVPHATDLGISAINAANILAITGLVGIAGRIILGIAGDRMGNRIIIIISFTMLSVILFWLPFAKTAWTLYLFAAIFGFAYGGFASLQSPLVAELFGLSSHGIILGVIQFGNTLAGAIGPVIAGRIFDIMDNYNIAFLICATLGTVAVVIALLFKQTTSQGGKNDSERSYRLH